MTPRLSEHFTLDEVLRNSGERVAPAHVLTNARHTAEVLEMIRRQLGDRPMVVSSWYRPPAKNADTLGAARNSAHLTGYGVDFNVPGMSPAEILARIGPHIKGIPVDQIINERDHVHVSADPRARRQMLVEVREGEYLPWTGAGSHASGPTIRAVPEPSSSHAPGSLLWWVALAVAVLVAVLNFLSGKLPSILTP